MKKTPGQAGANKPTPRNERTIEPVQKNGENPGMSERVGGGFYMENLKNKGNKRDETKYSNDFCGS